MKKIGKEMKKWIPLVLLLALMLIIYLTGLMEFFTFDVLKSHRQAIVTKVSNHVFLAPILFIALYMVVTSLSLPVGFFLSITGGFLFPQPFSTIYVVIGATLGASIVFEAVKTALGDFLKNKAGPRLQKLEKGFQKNKISYLFFLRLVFLFPFWLVNLAPALFGVTLVTFVWTTFIGIIPGTFVFTQAGTGLGAILDSDQQLSLSVVLNSQVKIALFALGVFMLLPIVIKKIRKNHD